MNELLERREQSLGRGAPLFYKSPLTIVRGEGVYLYDDTGRQFVDMYNNVPCVGHCNPHVVDAMHRQAATLNVHSRYLHNGVVEYAERLASLFDGSLEAVVFGCSGTEAVEVAMHMARASTGNRGFICTDAAYHGNSLGVGRLSHLKSPRDEETRSIPYPNRFRPVEPNLDEEALADRYCESVQMAIDEFEKSNVGVAGMVVCPILANEGLPDIPVGFMRKAAELVRSAGGVFICDEVQAGFCRTGRWWGHQVSQVAPDIVALGKPMGNGFPLSGVVASRSLVDQFRRTTRYFNTFASSPLQAAVGSAVIDVLEQEDIATHVHKVGSFLKASLRELQHRVGPFADTRGHGLFIGLEWVDDEGSPDRDEAVRVVNALKDKGFLIGNAGAHGNVVKIRPPLVFSMRNAEAFLSAFGDTMQDLYDVT